MLNLIWLFNPNFAFQSCRTPPDCNYTFLYLSIMGTPCYMLIYNYLRLSETLPHEFFTNFATRLKDLSNQKCAGVFYWEPEDYKGWNGGYTKGAFTNDGYPNNALIAFFKI